MNGTPFGWLSVPEVVCGENSLEKLPELLYGLLGIHDDQSSSVLVITDKVLRGLKVFEEIVERLELLPSCKITICDSVPREPSDTEIAQIYKEHSMYEYHSIICIGGGSVLDCGKILACMLYHRKRDVGELDLAALPSKGLPTIMIPTTAGTGSEATPNVILRLETESIKMGFVSKYFMPDLVLLDPSMTMELPAQLVASTGIDALCHLLECYTSKKSNPYSEMMALEGMRLLFSSLPKVYSASKHEDRSRSLCEERSALLLASFYGGACIATSGTHAVHALSYPLGGRFRLPHGVSNAILLVPVFEQLTSGITDKLRKICEHLGMTGIREDMISCVFIQMLKDLVSELGIPTTLKELGVGNVSIDELTTSALGVKRLLGNCPIEIDEQTIRRIYEQIT